MANRKTPNSTARKLHTVLTPRQDSEVRRIVHIIFGEAFGLSRDKVVALGEVPSPNVYRITLENHADIIAPMVSMFRSMVSDEKLKARRILNKDLQGEFESRNLRLLEILDERLNSEDKDWNWEAFRELVKHNAPVKTIQKHEIESVKMVYNVPVGPLRRMQQLATKPQLQLAAEAASVIDAEVVDDGEAN